MNAQAEPATAIKMLLALMLSGDILVNVMRALPVTVKFVETLMNVRLELQTAPQTRHVITLSAPSNAIAPKASRVMEIIVWTSMSVSLEPTIVENMLLA